MATSIRKSRRAIITSKDIEVILGRKDRAARQFLHTIKMALGKPKHQFVTVEEFCEYTGIPEELVRELMND